MPFAMTHQNLSSISLDENRIKTRPDDLVDLIKIFNPTTKKERIEMVAEAVADIINGLVAEADKICPGKGRKTISAEDIREAIRIKGLFFLAGLLEKGQGSDQKKGF